MQGVWVGADAEVLMAGGCGCRLGAGLHGRGGCTWGGDGASWCLSLRGGLDAFVCWLVFALPVGADDPKFAFVMAPGRRIIATPR